MIKRMQRKGLKFLLCFIFIFLLSDKNVMAEEYHRRDGIQSRGSLSFEQGKVYITANDFIYLADKIDALEKTYKTTLVDTLNQINVYFRNDGSLAYDNSLNEIDTEEEKGKLSFEYIKKGIILSQSVESVYNVQAIDWEGNPLYFSSEEAKNSNEYLNITNTDTGYPLYYKETSARNLSAGFAAWVNGELIKGTGEDNHVSWNNGYNEGYTQGVADALNKVNIKYSYHSHIGNNSSVGGCYGKLTGKTPIYCGCDNYAYDQDGNGSTRCAFCYHNHGGDECNAVISYDSYTYIDLVCGKTTKTIESATIVY